MGSVLLNNTVIVALLLVVGCTTPRAVFNCKRDTTYAGKLDRVLVVSMHEEEEDATFSRHFARTMTSEIFAQLNKHGVDAHVTSPNPNEMEPQTPVLETMVRYRPHQLLYIGATQVRRDYWVERNFSRRIYRSELGRVVFEAKVVDVP